jgi:exportin-1
MACETFEEIARRCRQAFSSDKQTGSQMVAFLEQLLQDLPRVVRYLPPKLIHQLWKGFGWIIKAEKNDEVSNKLLVSVMAVPNMVWCRSIDHFRKDPSTALNDTALCNNLINVLRTNCSLCETLRRKYSQQLAKILKEMLHVYKVSAHALAQYGESNGPQSMRHDIAIAWRNIIHSSLELLNTSIKTGCLKQFDVISSALDTVLTQFSKVLPTARDPLVYVLLTTVVETQKNKLDSIVSILLRAIVIPTQQMIDNNEEFPDHRKNFFTFLRELVTHCFPAVSKLNGEQFNRIVNIILWSMKHLDQQMAEIGLETLLELLKRTSSSNIANEFYTCYLAQILTDVFNVLTDTMHKGGYPLQVKILQQLINLVDSGNITRKLWSDGDGNFNSNVDCVKHCIVKLMRESFPNLHQQTIINFAVDLFKHCQVKEKFEITVQDFLIRTREVQTGV